MAHAIRVDSPFATVRDTADALGVSKSRTKTLIERTRRITSKIMHRSSGGEFTVETLTKRSSGRTVATNGRPNGGAKTYKTKSKKAKAKR